MEILDRYLKAVKRHLPRGQQEDIVAELSANLASEMEQRAAELGRPLSEVEEIALLERHGDPLVVAGRYRKDQRSLVLGRQLIGPEWFSLYWNVLWLTLGVTVVAAVLISRSLGTSLTLPGLLLPLFVELALVTLVFALIDIGHRRVREPRGLLDRYLQLVRDGLPREQEDIVAELRENLRSQIDDKEVELGRPLADVELETLLTAHGHPLLVAGRYLLDGRRLSFGWPLIGPVLFRLYLKILALNMALSLVGCLVALSVFASQGSLWHWVPSLLVPAIFQLGIITTIFAAIERWAVKNPGSWNQRSPGWAKPEAEHPPRVPRLESVLQLGILAVFFAGLRTMAVAVPGASDSAGLAVVAPWHLYSMALLALVMAEMVQPLVNLVRPEWTGLRPWARVLGNVLWLGIVCVILTTGPWVALTGPDTALADKRRLVENGNAYIFYGVLSMAVFSVGVLLVEIRRLMQHRRRS